MSDTNDNKNCAFSEQAISYLYNEIEPGEKIVFEAHLKNCPICIDDLNGFGLTRSSVSVWREIEFQKMQTPNIEFSGNQTAEIINPNVSKVEKKFRFAGIREFFNPAAVWASGFAMFLVICGLMFFVQNRAGKSETAKIDEKDNQEISASKGQTKPAETAENENVSSNPFSNTGKETNYAANSAVGGRNAKESLPVNKKTAPAGDIKNLTKADKSVEVAQSKIKPLLRRVSNAAQMPTVSQKIVGNKKPTQKLNDIEIEEEDESSLRLAELFEEVGGK